MNNRSVSGRYLLALVPAAFLLATPAVALRGQTPSAGGAGSAVQDSLRELRYDLRAGDRLVYKQTFVREVDGRRRYGIPGVSDRIFGEPVESRWRFEWTSHVLILPGPGTDHNVGFQRNLVRADLERFEVRGEDRRAAQRTAFDSTARRDTMFAHANRLTARGLARLPWTAAREAPSRLLWDVYELQPLPSAAVRRGASWTTENALGYAMRAVRWERLGDEECLRSEGTTLADLLFPGTAALGDSLRLRYWFCPGTGLVRRVEFEGTYPSASFQKVHEVLTIELGERRRGERLERWLADPTTRQGALAALLVSDSVLLEPAALYAMLDDGDDASRRKVLSLAYRRRLPPPETAVLTRMLESRSPRVRTLAVRLLERKTSAESRPLIERALADSDYFVRQAALSWARRRLPVGRAVTLRGAADIAPVWSEVTDSAVDDPAVGASSPAEAAGRCQLPSDWVAHVARRRRVGPDVAGVQMRGMTGAEWRGWPYVLQVPDDYRGDEPAPLLIYLAGNAGPALEGLALAHNALEETGYLVLYPNAANQWWGEQPTAMMSSLLDETMRSFNVDPERVFITGLSNGGTGTFYFASLWPHRFSAAVSAMGAGFYSFAVSAGDRPFATNVASLPLLFLHGTRDAVIADSATRGTVRALTGRRAPLEMHLFKDRGHGITLGAGDDGMTLRFLERDWRRATPRTLHFKTATLRNARHYWLEVLERSDPVVVRGELNDQDLARRVREVLSGRSVAEVNATIGDDNVIRLDTRNVRRLRLLLRPDLLPRDGPVRILLDGKQVFAGALPSDCALLDRTLRATGDPYLAYSSELSFEVSR